MLASPIFYEIEDCADWIMDRRVGKSWDNQEAVNFEGVTRLMSISQHASSAATI
jgi:hypothetical protein